MKLWLHHIDNGALPLADTIGDKLAHSGVEVLAFEPFVPVQCGVLVAGGPGSAVDDFLQRLSKNMHYQVLVVIPFSAKMNAGQAVHWMRLGAVDILICRNEQQTIEAILARLGRWLELDKILRSPLVTQNLVGSSVCWKTVLRQIVELSLFSDRFVLITGQSGTGKELVARLIHTLDPRVKNRELIVVDCTTIVPSLSGSELFGHTDGAYTGATRSRKGAFELADGSTLFLDEIGELPLELQGELLRVIQEKTYKKVGSNSWNKTEFRLICATNRDLVEEVKQGRFRADLFHRISAWPCQLPALRERTEDILPIARHFLKRDVGGRSAVGFDPIVEELLLSRDYPGNVRELKNLVTRMAGRHVGNGPISVGDLAPEDWVDTPEVSSETKPVGFESALTSMLNEGLGQQEIGEITSDLLAQIAISQSGGNLSRAAGVLKVTPRALQQRRKRWLERAGGS